MKKKILFGLSLAPLLLVPLFATSCSKKEDDYQYDWSWIKNNEYIITGSYEPNKGTGMFAIWLGVPSSGDCKGFFIHAGGHNLFVVGDIIGDQTVNAYFYVSYDDMIYLKGENYEGYSITNFEEYCEIEDMASGILKRAENLKDCFDYIVVNYQSLNI